MKAIVAVTSCLECGQKPRRVGELSQAPRCGLSATVTGCGGEHAIGHAVEGCRKPGYLPQGNLWGCHGEPCYLISG